MLLSRRSRASRALVAAAALGLMVATGAAGPARAGRGGPVSSETVTCQGLVPATVPKLTGSKTLDVRIVVDTSVGGLTQSAAAAVMSYADANIFPGAGVDLNLSYSTVSYSGPYQPEDIFTYLHNNFGTLLANGTLDIVHMITRGNLVGNDGVSPIDGQADCIGGIQLNHRSYSVAEDSGATAVSARLNAHEIAHLLGGQHHYAECATGSLAPGGPCTVLFPASTLSLRSDAFSALNASVIRAHAQQWG